MTARKSDVESTPSADGQALPASAGSTFFVLDWDWLFGAGKGENRYDCLTCKAAGTEYQVVSEVVDHTKYGERVSRRRCTGCGFEEQNRWIPAAW